MREQVYLPSSTDPRGGVTPVLTIAGGVESMAIGVSPAALGPIGSLMRFVVTLTGRQVLAGLGERNGVVVLLADGGAFEISAGLAGEARRRFGIEPRPDA